MLTAGDSGEAEMVVQISDTAKVLALSNEDSFPEVFATSRMIALMELAAARAVRGEEMRLVLLASISRVRDSGKYSRQGAKARRKRRIRKV